MKIRLAVLILALYGSSLLPQTYNGYNGRSYQWSPGNGRSYQPCLSFYPVDVLINGNAAAPGAALTTTSLAASTQGVAKPNWIGADANGAFGPSVVVPASVKVQSETEALGCGFKAQAILHHNVNVKSNSQFNFPSAHAVIRVDGEIDTGMTIPDAGGPTYDSIVVQSQNESVVVQSQFSNNSACNKLYGVLRALTIESSDSAGGGVTRHSYDDNGASGCIQVASGGRYFYSLWSDHTNANIAYLSVYDLSLGPPTAATLIGSTSVKHTGTANLYKFIRYGNGETAYTSNPTDTGFVYSMISWTDTTYPNAAH